MSPRTKFYPALTSTLSAPKRQAQPLSERGGGGDARLSGLGPEGVVFSMTAQDFQRDARKLLGYSAQAPELEGLRDLFKGARLAYLYRVNTGGKAAENNFAAAKYPGTAGNKITVVVTQNEATTEAAPVYDVETLFDGVKVDEQKGSNPRRSLRGTITWSGRRTGHWPFPQARP